MNLISDSLSKNSFEIPIGRGFGIFIARSMLSFTAEPITKPVVPNQACPTGAGIESPAVWGGAMPSSLANAIEIPDDPNGNNNGICESGETCYFAPNFGAYQGEGGFY